MNKIIEYKLYTVFDDKSKIEKISNTITGLIDSMFDIDSYGKREIMFMIISKIITDDKNNKTEEIIQIWR